MTSRRTRIEDLIKAKELEKDTRADTNAALAQERDSLGAELDTVRQRYRALKEDRRENVKERQSREVVQTLKQRFPGVKGRLVDLVRPRQRKYHAAVGQAMGQQAQKVVCDTGETASRCIKFLRDQRLCAMGFLPVQTLVAAPVNEAVRRIASKDSFRLVIDVLEFDDQIRTAVLYAVGSTVVCSTLDEARDFVYRKCPRDRRTKTVTLAGQVISKGGNMTGGISTAHANTVDQFDQKDVDEARERRDALEAKQEELNQRLRAAGLSVAPRALDAAGGAGYNVPNAG